MLRHTSATGVPAAFTNWVGASLTHIPWFTVLLITLVWWELRTREPIVNFRVLRNIPLSVGAGMASARAVLEGRPPPERRPPCFFDPRHGPSVEDVEWTPPGGIPRTVPACAADAQRIRGGEDPQARQVPTGAGGRVPYYNAPGYYAPWFGGYFGGFGGLFTGFLLGSALGGWGYPVYAGDPVTRLACRK